MHMYAHAPLHIYIYAFIRLYTAVDTRIRVWNEVL